MITIPGALAEPGKSPLLKRVNRGAAEEVSDIFFLIFLHKKFA